jgi:hypothetical protein
MNAPQGSDGTVSLPGEFVIDGNNLNKMFEPYNLESYQPTSQLHHMLPSQVFDMLEKKAVKDLLAQIDTAKVQSVKFVNLEAMATGPHKDYLYAIAGSLVTLIDSLTAKNIQVNAIIQNPLALPWNLVAKLDKNFKGIPAPGEQTPP